MSKTPREIVKSLNLPLAPKCSTDRLEKSDLDDLLEADVRRLEAENARLCQDLDSMATKLNEYDSFIRTTSYYTGLFDAPLLKLRERDSLSDSDQYLERICLALKRYVGQFIQKTDGFSVDAKSSNWVDSIHTSIGMDSFPESAGSQNQEVFMENSFCLLSPSDEDTYDQCFRMFVRADRILDMIGNEWTTPQPPVAGKTMTSSARIETGQESEEISSFCKRSFLVMLFVFDVFDER